MTINRVKKDGEDYEEIYTWADQYSGTVSWSKYDFQLSRLIIRYRLDETWYEYKDISLDLYNEFRDVLLEGTLEDQGKYMEQFKRKHNGEAL